MAVNNILNTDGGTMNVQAGIVSGIGGIGGDLNNQAGTIAPGNAEEIISIVPEPTAAFLVIISIAGLVGYNGRRRKR